MGTLKRLDARDTVTPDEDTCPRGLGAVHRLSPCASYSL